MSEVAYPKVRDVMVTEVRTIGRTATVKEAIDAMREASVSSLAVERRDESDEFGLLVVSDIAREVIAKGRAPSRVNVYEVMSKPVVTLPSDMHVKYAVRLLVRLGLSRALVVDAERQPVGIVTLRDLVVRYPADTEPESEKPEN
ncbi:MAG: CBS domain-containing protein [Proteobacteria bacterium]|nr:CBS domain-containing protein [Pseudomonadota bacterium]